MDAEDKKMVLELLKNLQILMTKQDGSTAPPPLAVKQNAMLNFPEQQKENIKTNGFNGLEYPASVNEKTEKTEKIINSIEKVKKVYVKKEKCEKDIYNCINSENKKVGIFYGTSPCGVAKKVANRMYKECEKKIFDVKIYNRMTDRLYSYRVQVVDCERVKKIGKLKIPITHDIKLTRI